MVKVVAAGRAISPLVMRRNMHKPLYMDQSMVAHILSSSPKVGLIIYDPNTKSFDQLTRKNYREKCAECDLDLESAKGKREIGEDSKRNMDNWVHDYETQGWPLYKPPVTNPHSEPTVESP